MGQVTSSAVTVVFSGRRVTEMGNLSPHFSESEFACHCGCSPNVYALTLCQVLEYIRAYADDKPITVLSGYRCRKHNCNVGGARNSQHMLGRAADISVKWTDPNAIFYYAKAALKQVLGPRQGGVGLYDSFVHVDTREGRMWRGDMRKGLRSERHAAGGRGGRERRLRSG